MNQKTKDILEFLSEIADLTMSYPETTIAGDTFTGNCEISYAFEDEEEYKQVISEIAHQNIATGKYDNEFLVGENFYVKIKKSE